MCRRTLIFALVAFTRMLLGFAIGAEAPPQPKLSVLVVDGINNHDWERATRILKAILLDSGRFKVDVTTSPSASAPADQWKAWKPDFARYDVVVMNFNGGHTDKGFHWPRNLEQALEDYVSGGGGLLAYHAANNSFPKWPAYNQMIGLGWRDKSFGPSVIVDEDGKVVTIRKGQGLNPGHGPEHDFQVAVLYGDHPITRGMPRIWMHPHEQLTHGQHGPAENMTVLTCAFSRDTKQREVMDWVIPYGKGRVYTTMLGHLWKDGPDTAMSCVGFQTMLVRGVEWAATGKVTLPMPSDFPTETQIRLRNCDRQPTPPDGHVSGSQPARDDKVRRNNEDSADRVPESPKPLAAIVGDYYHGDGLGVNCSLAIKPEGRFSFVWRGCLGVYGQNQGGATVVDDHLILRPEQPNDSTGFGGTPTDFVPVRWGERLYLVPKQAGMGFCSLVNEGWEPRSMPHGNLYLRKGYEEKEVTGLPMVPKDWEPMLQKKPIGRQK
jgi:type 1 glutamine amidotransferase